MSLPYIIFLDIFPIDAPYCHKYSPGDFEIPHGMKKITNTLDWTDSIIHNHTIMRFPFNTITLQCVPFLDLEFNRYIWPLFFSSVLQLTTHVTRYWEVSIVQIWPCVLPLDVPWIVHEILSAMSNSVMWRIRWFESIASQYLLYIISKYVFVLMASVNFVIGHLCGHNGDMVRARHLNRSPFVCRAVLNATHALRYVHDIDRKLGLMYNMSNEICTITAVPLKLNEEYG